VRGGGDLAHLAEDLDIGRAVVEVEVADQAAEGVAAELVVFFVPGRALVALELLAEIDLADVEDLDLQHLVGLGVVHQVMQAAPGAFELLELGVVQDRVDLLREFLVDLGDHGLDRDDDVAADQIGVGERLLRQRQHRGFNRALGLVALGLELLVQQRGKVATFVGDALKGAGGLGGVVCHGGWAFEVKCQWLAAWGE
jgi:hypothetical protein